MIVGAATVFIWDGIEQSTGAEIFTLYEIVPGFVLNLLVAVVVSLATYREDAEIDEEFTRTDTMVAVRSND